MTASEDPTSAARIDRDSIDEGDRCAGLAGSGCHHQQELSLKALHRFSNARDSLNLVRSAGDSRIRTEFTQRLAVGSLKEEALQIFPCEEATDLTQWISRSIPKPGCVSVGKKDKRVRIAV
jgi:hypothetical protein